MQYKFLNASRLKELLNKPEHYNYDNEFYVVSISDVLYLQEQYKKGILNLKLKKLHDGVKLIQDTDGNGGLYYLQDLDHSTLKANLFDDNELDLNIANRVITPRHSITRAVLKLSDSIFWDEQLIEEMEDWYLNSERIDIE